MGAPVCVADCHRRHSTGAVAWAAAVHVAQRQTRRGNAAAPSPAWIKSRTRQSLKPPHASERLSSPTQPPPASARQRTQNTATGHTPFVQKLWRRVPTAPPLAAQPWRSGKRTAAGSVEPAECASLLTASRRSDASVTCPPAKPRSASALACSALLACGAYGGSGPASPPPLRPHLPLRKHPAGEAAVPRCVTERRSQGERPLAPGRRLVPRPASCPRCPSPAAAAWLRRRPRPGCPEWQHPHCPPCCASAPRTADTINSPAAHVVSVGMSQ